MPLPASPYETAVWSTATIQPDYLIKIGDCKYSVPYEFIGKKVDIRATENSIEVFYHSNRSIACAQVLLSGTDLCTGAYA